MTSKNVQNSNEIGKVLTKNFLWEIAIDLFPVIKLKGLSATSQKIACMRQRKRNCTTITSLTLSIVSFIDNTSQPIS